MDLVIGPGILLGGIIKPIEPLGIAMLMAFIISLLVKYVVEIYVQKRKGSIFEGEWFAVLVHDGDPRWTKKNTNWNTQRGRFKGNTGWFIENLPSKKARMLILSALFFLTPNMILK